MPVVEFMISVRVNGVVDAELPTTSESPDGEEAKFTSAVSGSRRIDLVSERPPESVTVSCSSSQAGYSWSGAVKEPLVIPVQDWMLCVWQFVGSYCQQWWRMSVHVKPDAATVPSSASLAEPAKLITSPTAHLVVVSGRSISAVGGVLFGVTTIGWLIEDWPVPSVTLSR